MAKYVDQRLLDGSPCDPESDEALLHALESKVEKIVALKPFPVAAQQLARLGRSPAPDPQEVLNVLESDRALGRKLLRLVNTSGFTSHSRCHTLQHAITLLGVHFVTITAHHGRIHNDRLQWIFEVVNRNSHELIFFVIEVFQL